MKPTPHYALHPQVYEPCEDSFFLIDCLEVDETHLQSFVSPVVVEIGSGSGVLSAFAHSMLPKALFFATDINLAACETTSKTCSAIEPIRASLMTCLRPNSVDILIFNPPYVPTMEVPSRPSSDVDNRWLDLALDGGDDGMEITSLVLEGLKYWLAPGGSAYILFCASNRPKDVMARMTAAGWSVTDLGTRRAGWEILTVLRFDRSTTM